MQAFPFEELEQMTLRRRPIAVVIAGLLAIAAACGSSTPAPLSTASLVQPPPVALQGCTWTVNGSVPQGAPQGLTPAFPHFSPDQAAVSALKRIKAKGGTGLVYGVSLVANVPLHAGPDASQAPIASVPPGQSITVSEPGLWTTSSGAQWLAFFLACGGSNLYWASVQEIAKVSPNDGVRLHRDIPALLAAAPYTTTGKTSALPIIIDSQRHLVWATPKVPFAVWRGELIGY
jgi:hypothetical protein